VGKPDARGGPHAQARRNPMTHERDRLSLRSR
jgi:hypothetical protein